MTETQNITVTVPPNLLHLASKIAGHAGATANGLIEAAFKLYSGMPREDVISQIGRQSSDRASLREGGKKSAKIDRKWLVGIESLSSANRVGLLMLVYDMTRDEAEEFEANGPWHIKPGRPRKTRNEPQK